MLLAGGGGAAETGQRHVRVGPRCEVGFRYQIRVPWLHQTRVRNVVEIYDDAPLLTVTIKDGRDLRQAVPAAHGVRIPRGAEVAQPDQEVLNDDRIVEVGIREAVVGLFGAEAAAQRVVELSGGLERNWLLGDGFRAFENCHGLAGDQRGVIRILPWGKPTPRIEKLIVGVGAVLTLLAAITFEERVVDIDSSIVVSYHQHKVRAFEAVLHYRIPESVVDQGDERRGIADSLLELVQSSGWQEVLARHRQIACFGGIDEIGEGGVLAGAALADVAIELIGGDRIAEGHEEHG